MYQHNLIQTLLSSRARKITGSPISDLMSRALANPNLISLAAGFVDTQTLPIEIVGNASSRIAADKARSSIALQYGTTFGSMHLREDLIQRQRQADGQPYPNLTPDRVVLTAGSNQLLHLVVEALIDAGDVILCAAPTYLVFMGTLGGAGGSAWGVETDEFGIIPEALEAQLKSFESRGELNRIKAIYTVSYFDNPCGLTMPTERREKIVRVAQKYSKQQTIFVIDDAAYRELRYSGDDYPSMLAFDPEHRHVIVAGTFSKSFSPGVRVGWGLLPPSLISTIDSIKGNIDFGSPRWNQEVMVEVLRSGDYARQVATLQKGYATKAAAMLRAIESNFSDIPNTHWTNPTGGLYVWLELDPSLDVGPNSSFFRDAVERGVLYVPGEFCFPEQGAPIKRNTMRLSFGVQTPAGIEKGIRLLAETVRAHLPKVLTTAGK